MNVRRAVVSLMCLVVALNLTAVRPIHSTPMDGHNLARFVPTYAERFAAPGFGPPITPVLGVIHVLVLAVDFQDTSAKMSIAELKQQWFGTVPAYYHEASYGKLTIQGNIYGWYQLPHPQSYYGKNCLAINDADCSGTNQSWKIANDTVALAENNINFSQYDYFVFLHSGTGQETSLKNDDIWSVTYLNASIPTPTKTLTRFSIVPELEAPPNVPNGVWCVEFAHDLGVPDLYDTRNGPNHGKPILGPWELMDKGSWNGDPPGSLPAHMTAWAKIQLGWINGSMLTTVTAGTSTIAVYPTEVASYQVHAIRIPISATQNSTQYYLVEVRKQIGFDAALPTSGVLITFVNETQAFGVVSVINSDPAVADLADAVWHLDQTFSDNAHKLTIDVTGETATYYDVSVTLGSNTLPTPRLTSTNSTNSTEKISINGVPLTVELATTLPAQERGLSGLPSLPKNEGMLFIFDHEDYWAFWMIDMQFPLDIIWFNSAHEVVWTEPNLQPCPPSNCPVIMPSVKSMYVLEVNAGFVAANHIRLGMRFYFT